ncbi:conserved hypothetical protein [Ricinus communis]|uniref:Terpene synthase metal-binding domain-containing protein n=1 Tax=Ricinus communis TaxID=3988 RepID=B9SY51_RICCO|nr:conserved hypothetical protein [Ricinus communis]
MKERYKALIDVYSEIEENMAHSLVTSAYAMLAATSLVGMAENIVNKDTFDWLFSEPKMVTASAIVCSLSKKEGMLHPASSYMKQHSATENKAVQEFHGRTLTTRACTQHLSPCLS